MHKRLFILNLAILIASSGCTLINEARFGDEAPDGSIEEGCGAEGSACTTAGGEAGECRGQRCAPIDERPCAGEDCEVEPDGPGITSFSAAPGERSGTSVEFRFASTVSTALFECALDEATFAECAPPVRFSDLADGDHTFRVRALGQNGLREAPPLVHEWLVDSTVLDTFLIGAPPAKTGRSISFEFDGSLAVSFECKLEPLDTDFAPCESPKAYSALFAQAGGYDFSVRALSESGEADETPAAHHFDVDSTGPIITIAGSPSPNQTISRDDVSFTFSASEPVSHYLCAVDQNTVYSACATPFYRDRLRPGAHTIYVKGVDEFGNESPYPATRSWTITPRMISNIRLIRTEPITDGTWITLDEGYQTDHATRVTYIDEDAYERYWIQQSDGSSSPDNAGILVRPDSGFPTNIGVSPTVTGIVRVDEAGQYSLDDASFQMMTSNTYAFSGRWIDSDADEVKHPGNQGLVVVVGGDLRAGSGGCQGFGPGAHFRACNGAGQKVVCLDDTFGLLPPAPQLPHEESWLSITGIPLWTTHGVQLLVIDVDERGDDVCM